MEENVTKSFRAGDEHVNLTDQNSTVVWIPALKINCGPPTANLWSDWSPQKRVNRDKLDQRQNVHKSRFLSTVLLITPLSTQNHHSKSVEFGSNFKFSQICQNKRNLRGQNNDFEVIINGLERTEQWFGIRGDKTVIFWGDQWFVLKGDKTIFLVDYKRNLIQNKWNLRGHNNDFGGNNDL